MKKIKELYKKYEEIINYIIVGVLTTVVSLVSKWILLFTILNPKSPTQLQIAVIISWILAVTFAYITNRVFVFQSKNKNILKEVFSFFLSRISTLLIEMFLMWFLITILNLNSNMGVVISTLLVQLIIMTLNYLFSKLLVFKNK